MSVTRRFSAVVALVAATVLLSGCQFFPNIVAPSPEPAPASLEAYYGQNLSWENCGAGVECTTVSAPLNWDDPAGLSIDLAVVRNPASGTPLGSLLVNPGGPGGSGWDFVFYGGDYAVSPALMESYDVIGWDPRGVGQSTPVTCYTDSADRDESLYGTFDNPYNSEGWIEELTADEEAFAAACELNTGELLGHIDSASVAQDMDLIRAVLGDEKLNYLGYSYGTFLGTMYAELFPEKVGRMVLDGAIDPLLSDFESLKVQMAGFDSAFRAYMEYCLSSADCTFTGSVDDGLAQARAVLDEVDARALVASDGREFDSATLGTAIASALYSESSWPELTGVFADLEAGDADAAFASADRYNSRGPDGTYYGNSFEVYTAVTCLDGDFLDDPKSTLERVAEIDAAAPILGKYFAYDDYAVLDTACTHWPVPEAELPTAFDAEGAAPILVIGTTNDPATPYAWAQSLASQLSSGVLVTYRGEGHTAYNQGVSCVDSAVDEYFLRGTVPAADPMC